MFKLKLDEEINLVFLDVSLAKLYLKLRNENLNYLSQFLSWPTLIDNEESMKKWIQDRLIDYARGTKLFLAIEYKKDIIGISGFNNINLTLRKLELAYWIVEKHQGKGIVTRICQFLIDYAFKNYEIDKIEIRTAENNKASRAVCIKLGMELEGVISHSGFVNDVITSSAVYALFRKK